MFREGQDFELGDLVQSYELGDLVIIRGSVPLKMIWISPGTFRMGSPENEPDRMDLKEDFDATISSGFCIGNCPVTQGQFMAVGKFEAGVLHPSPSLFAGLPDSGDRPVERLCWMDAQNFASILNRRYKRSIPPGYSFGLPGEAQWEYACRAGTETRYCAGDLVLDLDRVGWHAGNSGGSTHSVGQKPANAWGLFDMHGNVAEWCHDWYGPYPCGDCVDFVGSDAEGLRTVRGGHWMSPSEECRSASRGALPPEHKDTWTGFRIALRT